MKLTFEDNLPFFYIAISLLLTLFLPGIRENDVQRVGMAIIHIIIAVNYLTGLIILKAIRNLEDKIK